MSIKFYDTCAVLELGNKIFEEPFVICSKTIEELENIKTNARKDESIKYKARNIIRLLTKNEDKYEVVIYNCEIYDLLKYGFNLDVTPDNIIMACAYQYSENYKGVLFYTKDLACRLTAKIIFGLSVNDISDNNEDEYKGFKEVIISDNAELAYFYENSNENIYGLLTNEYLVIKNTDGKVVDCYRWDGSKNTPVKYNNVKSKYLGNIKPYNGDVYQQCALDSLLQNQITMLKGKAGSGKSYLALGYLFHLLDKNKIDKIIVFCNTLPTNSSARLGFYPGSRDEKIFSSSSGGMLISKLGSSVILEQLIEEEKLVLMPMCDIRGFDTTSDSKVGVYISEAQNMDIYLMKLALQRIGENTICIIDGDYANQTDSPQYTGSNNGMRRVSEIFRGQDFYGEVELQNIYRSVIAKIAERM